MAGHYNDSEEQGNSIEAILEIAQLTHRPVAEVRVVYERELARLKSDARIMDYVSLFAGRRTRAHLSRIAS